MIITFDNLFGIIKLFCKKVWLRGKLNIKPVIRMSRTASIKIRKGGHISICSGVSLSSHTVISATENAKITIGNNSGLNYNTVVVAREKIEIGNNVMIGPNVAIYDHSHVFNVKNTAMRNAGYTSAPITIEDNVWIAANVVILKGVTIGTGSVIGAGCVIDHDIRPNSLVTLDRSLKSTTINR